MTKYRNNMAEFLLKRDVKNLLDVLLAENNETYEDLRIKLCLEGRALKNLKKGKIYNLNVIYRIAMIYGKDVKISVE